MIRAKSTFDDTFPLTCTIEGSQLNEGHGVMRKNDNINTNIN